MWSTVHLLTLAHSWIRKYTITNIVTIDSHYNLNLGHAGFAPGSKGHMFMLCTGTELASTSWKHPIWLRTAKWRSIPQ